MIELHWTNDKVAQALEKIGYEAVVLGGQGRSLIEAPGNAFVLAAPRENTKAIETIGRFQSAEA